MISNKSGASVNDKHFEYQLKKTPTGELKGLNAISTFHLKWGMTLRPNGPHSMPGSSVLQNLQWFAHIHVCWVGDVT